MFKKLFSKRKSLAEMDVPALLARLKTLDSADILAKQADIIALAKNHSDSSVRSACITIIDNFEALSALLSHSDITTVKSAISRLIQDNDLRAKLLEDNNLLGLPLVQHALIRSANTVEQAKSVVQASSLDKVELCLDSASSEVKTWLALLIDQESDLVRLEKLSRNRDKKINRLAREQLNQLRMERENLAQYHEDCDHLHDAANKLNSQIYLESAALSVENIQFTQAKLINLRTKYKTLELAILQATNNNASKQNQLTGQEPLPTKTSELLRLLDGTETRMNELLLKQAESNDKLADAKQQAQRQEQARQAAQDTKADQLKTDQSAQVINTGDMLSRQSQTQIEKNQALKICLAQTKTSPENYQSLWQQQEKSVKLLKTIDTLSDRNSDILPAGVEAAFNSFRSHQSEFDLYCLQVREKIEAQFTKAMNKLEVLLAEGKMKSATGLQAECRNQSRSLNQRNNAKLLARYSSITKKYADLNDWRSFAAQPKQIELCEAVENIADNPLPPEQQAETLKSLRVRWQALGSSNKALSTRFDAAATHAFVPCKIYFEEQNQIRTNNLNQRKGVLEQLRTYIDSNDWHNTDWKAAEKILRTARSEWNNHNPIDRSKLKTVQKSFDEACKKIHQKLNEERQRNLEKKQQYVEKAAELATPNTPIQDAIAEAKSLQSLWRSVGITPRAEDQKLWQIFRTHCDSIFSRRDQAHKNAQQQKSQHIDDVSNKYDQLLAAIQSCETTLSSQQQNIEEIKQAKRLYRELSDEVASSASDLPQALVKKLTRAEIQLGALQNSQKLMKRKALFEAFQTIDKYLIEIENKILAGLLLNDEELAQCFSQITQYAPANFSEKKQQQLVNSCKQRAETLFNTLKQGNQPAIDLFFSTALKNQTETVVRTELEAGVASTEQDQQLRMQLQLQRLNDGLAKRQSSMNNTDMKNPENMAMAWCGTVSCGEQRAMLSQRFFQALSGLD